MLFGQEKTMDTKILLVEDDTMLNEALPMLSEKRNIWYTAQKILRKRQAI